MNSKRLEQTIHQASKAKRRRDVLKSLAIALEGELNIQPGRQLAAPLDKGTERSNHDALISWLETTCSELNTEPAMSLLIELKHRLHTRLTQCEQERYYC
jgi:hypothetical protein